jgi:hypothetical protein
MPVIITVAVGVALGLWLYTHLGHRTPRRRGTRGAVARRPDPLDPAERDRADPLGHWEGCRRTVSTRDVAPKPNAQWLSPARESAGG